MNIKNTMDFVKELTLLALESNGWNAHFENGYVLASKDGEKQDLIICCTARCLSQGNFIESKMVNATFGKIRKMQNYLNTIEDDCIPCIAFGIIKYTIDEFEIAVVPVEVIKDLAEKGTVYSMTECGGYYYNYSKLKAGELPPGAILRKEWAIK